MTEPQKAERDAFEKYIIYDKYLGVAASVAKSPDGRYEDSLIHGQWVDWQAAFEAGRRSVLNERGDQT